MFRWNAHKEQWKPLVFQDAHGDAASFPTPSSVGGQRQKQRPGCFWTSMLSRINERRADLLSNKEGPTYGRMMASKPFPLDSVIEAEQVILRVLHRLISSLSVRRCRSRGSADFDWRRDDPDEMQGSLVRGCEGGQDIRC